MHFSWKEQTQNDLSKGNSVLSELVKELPWEKLYRLEGVPVEEAAVENYRLYLNTGKFVYFSTTNPSVRGGSFDNQNLEALDFAISDATLKDDCLFILSLPTGGVRLTHDRSIFDFVWKIPVSLYYLKRRHPLITIASGKCIGAGAVYFAQGHFRLVSGGESLINLTGPSIIKNVFGGGSLPYSEYASAAHQLNHNRLMGEVYVRPEHSLKRLIQIVRLVCGQSFIKRDLRCFQRVDYQALNSSHERKNNDLLDHMADEWMEIFKGQSSVARTYLCRIDGHLFGVLAQPYLNAMNAVDRSMVDQWKAALDFFRSLQIPLVSAIDTFGGDPRQSESDNDILMASIDLVESLIDYPFAKMGLIMKRSFGGSGLFVLPRGYGSIGVYALEGSVIGVMGDQVIEKAVSHKPKLKAEFEKTKEIHKADLSDMVANLNIKAVITIKEIKSIISRELINRGVGHDYQANQAGSNSDLETRA